MGEVNGGGQRGRPKGEAKGGGQRGRPKGRPKGGAKGGRHRGGQRKANRESPCYYIATQQKNTA